MFLLHIVQTSAARTDPSACLNRLQRITRPQHTGTQTVEVSSVMRLLASLECAGLYTANFASSWLGVIHLEKQRDPSCCIAFRDEPTLAAGRCYDISNRSSLAIQQLDRRLLSI